MRVSGEDDDVSARRSPLGEVTAAKNESVVLRSVLWSAIGHGDVVFVVAANFDPATQVLGEFRDVVTLRQRLGEDATSISPFTVPPGGTVRFLARAQSGAQSAGFTAEFEVTTSQE